MGSAASINTRFLMASLPITVMTEFIAVKILHHTGMPPLQGMALTRTLQMLILTGLALMHPGGLGVIGLDRRLLESGIRKGGIASIRLAMAAGLGIIGLSMAGMHPLALIHVRLPATPSRIALFFLVGGVIAPVVEEIIFRGIIFNYLQRWGAGLAGVISTLLFAACHMASGPPVIQIIGGAVFAVSFYKSGSLATPILIHSLGNLAIFTLSLPVFQ